MPSLPKSEVKSAKSRLKELKKDLFLEKQVCISEEPLLDSRLESRIFPDGFESLCFDPFCAHYYIRLYVNDHKRGKVIYHFFKEWEEI